MFWNGKETQPPAMTALPSKPKGWRAAPWGVRLLLGILLAPIWVPVAVVLAAVIVARWSLQQERRVACAPGWVFLIAAVTWWLMPSAEWAWALTALTLDVSTLPRVAAWWSSQRREWLSARERGFLARTCAGVAFMVAFAGPFPFVLRALLLAAVVLAGAVFWWKSRRIRETGRAWILDRWDADVAEREPRLAGEWLEFDEERGVGRLKLDNSRASEAAGLDEIAEWALDQPRGTVTIAADPRLSVREVRVAFTDHEYGSRLRLFDGSTLTPDGKFVLSYAKGAVPMYGRLWWEEGGCGIAIIAPPGRGKGSVQRLIAVTGALSDQIELFGACGKQGQGIGYLRPAFRIFTDTHEDSVDLIHGYLMAVRERARRYAKMGRDSFIPGLGDPRMMLKIDEPGWIIDYAPRVADWLEEITGTQRSTGAGLCMAIHKGDGPGFGSTKVRSNMITNGWRALGAMDDNQAKSTGLQGVEFDFSTIPDEPGWFLPVGRLLGGQPLVAGRVLFIPNHGDLDKHRALHPDQPVTAEEFAPFGFVEDWLTKTIHPELHPDTLAALGSPDPIQAVKRRAEAAAAPASQDEEAPHLSLVDTPPLDAWTKIEGVLSKAPAEGLLRGQIASEAGVVPRHTSDVLNAHAALGHVVKDEKSRWRLAS